MRVPWTARRFKQSIVKEISPGCSLEGLMLKLKVGHLMRRADSLEKTLMLGKIEGQRRKGRQRMRWLDGITLQCSCLENPRDGGAWWAAVYGVARSRTRLKRLSSSSSRVYKVLKFLMVTLIRINLTKVCSTEDWNMWDN